MVKQCLNWWIQSICIIIVLQVLILWILSLFIVIGVGIAAAVLTTDVSIMHL